MPKYLVKYSMVAYWEQEVEAEDENVACEMHDELDVSEEPLKWDDFSVDTVVDLESGKEYEIVTTYHGRELPNRHKENEND
jgi:hypothetical protein